ncbi:MAG: excisionase family protein [Methylomicrobium sp.]|nr:excisionase family protein [Methylomicrobium sp.]
MVNLKLFAEAQYQAALLQLNAASKLLETVERPSAEAQSSSTPEWIYINRLSEITGLTTNSIRNRIARGAWREGIHFRHECDKKKSRIIFNFKEISKWLAGE